MMESINLIIRCIDDIMNNGESVVGLMGFSMGTRLISTFIELLELGLID